MIQPEAQTPCLQAANICKTYWSGRRLLPVLDNVSVCAYTGEFVAVLGPSGCGKSTMLEILCGLQQPDSGKVHINGAGVTAPGQMSYMPQRAALLPWRNVLDNVTLGPILHGATKDAARQQAAEHMELFGLTGFDRSYPRELSGGMRQRAALLRTYLSGSAIIALDEPFGALDAITRRDMQEWLATVHNSLSATIIMVTHDIEEALLLADRIYVLTPRPGKNGAEFRIDLPRPRDVVSGSFTTHKAEVLAALREMAGSGKERM